MMATDTFTRAFPAELSRPSGALHPPGGRRGQNQNVCAVQSIDKNSSLYFHPFHVLPLLAH